MIALVVVGAAAIALVAGSHQASATPVVMAGDHSCTLSGRPHPGAQYFTVDDVGASATEVDIFGFGPTLTLQYGEIEDVGPGTSAPMPVDLGPGRYTLVCEPGRTDDNPITSTIVVTGSGPAVGGIEPTTDDDFAGPIGAYKAYVATQLAALSAGLGPLRSEVTAGNTAAAEADYPLVHADYERIGAAYDAFGTLNDDINGLSDGLPLGPADPDFTGFHKLELQLWSGAATPVVVATIDRLSSDVFHLRAMLPLVVITSLDYATRAHEILENALQEQVTGLAEPNSHTGIDDAAASTTGAEEVFATLRPLVARQEPTLPSVVTAGFARVDGILASLQTASGLYLPDNSLSISQHEQLTAAMSSLLEELAQIPGLITPPQEPRDVNEH